METDPRARHTFAEQEGCHLFRSSPYSEPVRIEKKGRYRDNFLLLFVLQVYACLVIHASWMHVLCISYVYYEHV